MWQKYRRTESSQTNKRKKKPVERSFQLFSVSSSFSLDTYLDFSECKSRMESGNHWQGRNRSKRIKKMTWKLEEKASRSSFRKVLYVIRNNKIMFHAVADKGTNIISGLV